MTNMRVWAAAVLAAVAAGPARAGDAAAPVPGDAAGFLTVRAGAISRGDFAAPLRQALAKASPAVLKALDESLHPHPATWERVTLVWPRGSRKESDIVLVLNTSAAFDPDKMQRSLTGSAEPAPAAVKVAGLARAWEDKSGTVLGSLEGNRVAVTGPKAWVAAALADADGPARAALARHPDADVVAGVNLAALPGFHDELKSDKVPQPLRPVVPLGLANFSTAAVSLKGKGVAVALRLDYPDADAAKAGLRAAKVGLAMAQTGLGVGRGLLVQQIKKPADGQSALDELPQAVGALAGLGGLQMVGDWLRALPVRADDTAVVAETTVEADPQQLVLGLGVAAGLLVPATQKVREAANRAREQNNLKQIALAFHNYAGAYNDNFPAAVAYQTKDGKPGLSWRVALLPYVEQDNLYRQFHLDEPWDSEHNIKLLDKMPPVYASLRVPAPKPGHTYFKVFTGKDTPFPPKGNARIPATFLDGTSNTILVYQGGEAVPWTKPEDTPFDPAKPLPKLAGPFGDVILVCLGDGSVRAIDLKKVSAKTIKGAITPAGGELLGEDW